MKDGIQDIYILSEEDGLLLRAVRPIEDTNEVGGPESVLARADGWMDRLLQVDVTLLLFLLLGLLPRTMRTFYASQVTAG